MESSNPTARELLDRGNYNGWHDTPTSVRLAARVEKVLAMGKLNNHYGWALGHDKALDDVFRILNGQL